MTAPPSLHTLLAGFSPLVKAGGIVQHCLTADQQVQLNAQASIDVAHVTAPFDFDGHIINGEVKKGKVVGGHTTIGNVRILGTASPPNSDGVYSANIEVLDPALGSWVAKTNNGGASTMFPASWTADRIKVEVDEAFKGKVVTGNKWKGTTPSGVSVTGYLKPNATVYPLL